jgi:hypothetical protein
VRFDHIIITTWVTKLASLNGRRVALFQVGGIINKIRR